MIIGIVKEIKSEETRVGLIPSTVIGLVRKGHQVLLERGAGFLSGIKDENYITAGAQLRDSPEKVWKEAELIIKVKEPQEAEYDLLQKDRILFTFFHFASNRRMTKTLVAKKVNCLAYELVSQNGVLPLLTPMSEIAGRLAAQEGAEYLEKLKGGKGLLLSGATGVAPGRVVIIGAGVVGINAARIAAGLGAEVTMLDNNLERLRYLEIVLSFKVKLLYSTRENLLREVQTADLIIGAVLIPGASAPKVLQKDDLKLLEKGTVLVDVSIDQGGCFETSRPTTHKNPTYKVDGILHYCVPNIPAVVPKTSTYALNYATAPYILALAETKGNLAALRSEDKLQAGLKSSLAIYQGKITNSVLAKLFAK